jgi:hypothetical protein
MPAAGWRSEGRAEPGNGNWRPNQKKKKPRAAVDFF